ncbi:MAG: DnaD domain protein [Bacilli bacterium]|nr:DnaD domain protein [Bacilli bacterium]MDD4808554.1 DnaD domain protein [Bacilli bacterium]
MIKVAILPADNYIVINRTVLTNQDRKLLMTLYQPIIGATSINLYFSLWASLEQNEVLSNVLTHHYLLSSMGISLSELVEAREKLEAIGLVKTYFRKDVINNYVYELYSPVSANDFLNNPILSTILYSTVGSTEFDKIVTYFKRPKFPLKDYENITCSFDEVFESSHLTTREVGNIEKVNYQKLNLMSKIDLDNILASIPEDLLNFKSITKEVRELITNLAFIYDLSDDDLSELIKNSINEKRNIDMEKLKNSCRNYYELEYSGKLPNLIYRNQPEYLRKPVGDTSKKSKLIYQFETTSPHDFLVMKNGGTRLNKNELAILEYLAVDMKLKPGVINVLIDYVLKINENKLIKKFIEVIASQWKRSKIETVEAAMKIAEEEFKNRQKPVKNHKTKETINKPEWFDKEIKAKLPDEEKLKQMEDMLKEYR